MIVTLFKRAPGDGLAGADKGDDGWEEEDDEDGDEEGKEEEEEEEEEEWGVEEEGREHWASSC